MSIANVSQKLRSNYVGGMREGKQTYDGPYDGPYDGAGCVGVGAMLRPSFSWERAIANA